MTLKFTLTKVTFPAKVNIILAVGCNNEMKLKVTLAKVNFS